MRMISDTFKRTTAAGSDTIDGREAFKLHDTYGIPIEITESLAADQNLRVDMAAFKKASDEARKIARGTADAADVFAKGPLDALRQAYHHGSEFLGYETTEAEGKSDRHPRARTACRVGRSFGQPWPADRPDPRSDALLCRVGRPDRRYRHDPRPRVRLHRRGHQEGPRLHPPHRPGHRGDRDPGLPSVPATVDAPRRQAIRRAHSATHLLHHALHRHLGKHAQQAGSKVEPDRLRFDFANPEAVGKERLEQIETTVNALVMTGDPVTWTHMPIAEAKSLGAMALFGEKYPDIVRVVRMGDFSKELCGGTHLDNVGQVGLFKIIGEESVASGTRRITALTGKAALDSVRQEEEILSQVAADAPRPPEPARRSRDGARWRRSRPSRSRRPSARPTRPARSRSTTWWPGPSTSATRRSWSGRSRTRRPMRCGC